jgi:hypothetical protein
MVIECGQRRESDLLVKGIPFHPRMTREVARHPAGAAIIVPIKDDDPATLRS